MTPLGRLLAIRHMTYADLSALTGLAVGTLWNLSANNNRSSNARARVEAALGVPVWSASMSEPVQVIATSVQVMSAEALRTARDCIPLHVVETIVHHSDSTHEH